MTQHGWRQSALWLCAIAFFACAEPAKQPAPAGVAADSASRTHDTAAASDVTASGGDANPHTTADAAPDGDAPGDVSQPLDTASPLDSSGTQDASAGTGADAHAALDAADSACSEEDGGAGVATVVRAHYPSAAKLLLRGDLKPLSWSVSVKPDVVGATTATFKLPASGGPWRVKLVLASAGKLTWQLGPNHVVSNGEERHIYPYFDPKHAKGRLTQFSVAGPAFKGAMSGPRTVRVFLPPGYDENLQASYPLLLMHDGQNVFEDKAAAFGVAWKAQDAMIKSIIDAKMQEVVIAAVDNGGAARLHEYTPWPDTAVAKGAGGGASQFLDFYEAAVLPKLQKNYRLKPGRQHRVIAGSSLGGLLSMYALVTRPKTYSGAMAISGSWWWHKSSMLPFVQAKLPVSPAVRLWLDAGDLSDGLAGAQQMRDAWLAKGYKLGKDLGFFTHKGGKHDEASWKARLHLPMQFFFNPGNREKAF